MRCKKCSMMVLPTHDKTLPSQRVKFQNKNHSDMSILFPPKERPSGLCYYHEKEEAGHFSFEKTPDKVCQEKDLTIKVIKGKGDFYDRVTRRKRLSKTTTSQA